MKNQLTLTTTILLILTLAGLMPNANAQDAGGWTVEAVGGLSSAPTQASVSGIGEKIGVAYRDAALDNIGFSWRDEAGAWTDASLDLGFAAGAVDPHLLGLEGDSWIVAVEIATTAVWSAYTTDDGATWSTPFQHLIATFDESLVLDLISQGGNDVAILFGVGPGATMGCGFQLSLDGGATWSVGQSILDNKGASGTVATATAQVDCDGGGAFITHTDNSLGVFGSESGGTTKALYFAAQSAFNNPFWNVPFFESGFCADGQTLAAGAPCPLARKDSETGKLILLTDALGQNDPMNGLAVSKGLTAFVAFSVPSDSIYTIPIQDFNFDVYPPDEYPDIASQADGTCTTPTMISAGAGIHYAIADNSGGTAILAFPCTTPESFRVMLWTSDEPAWALTYTNNALPAIDSVSTYMTPTKTFVSYQDTQSGNQLKLVWAITPVSIATSARVNVDNLVGFAIDPTGTAIITREAVGACIDGTHPNAIHAYQGLNLAEVGTCLGNECNRVDGVAALKYYLTYADCDGDSNGLGTDNLYIKSNTLGDPNCQSAGPECESGITATVEIPDNLRQLGRLQAARWDFNTDRPPVNEGAFLDSGVVEVCWTYSTIDGRVGVLCVQNNSCDLCPDQAEAVDTEFSESVEQICSWRNDNGKDLVGAAHEGVPFKVFIATAGPSVNVGSDPEPTFGDYFSSSGFGGAKGVGCGGNRVMVATASGRLGVMYAEQEGNHTRGETFWNVSIEPSVSRSVAMSDDGLWAAHYQEGTITIYCVDEQTDYGCSPGDVRDTLTMPTDADVGDYLEMALDSKGQNLWVASSKSIMRFEIIAATTLVPVQQDNTVGGNSCPNCVPGDADGDGIADEDEDSVFTNSKGQFVGGVGLCVAVFVAFDGATCPYVAWFVDLILVMGLAFAIGRKTKYDSPLMYGIAFTSATALTTGLWGLHWVYLALIAIVALAIVVMQVRGSGSGAT